MTVNFSLKRDLENFKQELIAELKLLFNNPGACKEEKDWITDAEARKLLSISRTKLYQLRKDGNLPYSKMGGRIYYRMSDIDYLLNENLTNYEK